MNNFVCFSPKNRVTVHFLLQYKMAYTTFKPLDDQSTEFIIYIRNEIHIMDSLIISVVLIGERICSECHTVVTDQWH